MGYMDQQVEGQPTDEATAAADVPTDAATLNSDAAVGGSVGGGSGERRRDAPGPDADAADGAGGGSGDHRRGHHGHGHHHHNGQPVNAVARQRHYRKRALSTAGTSSGTIEEGAAVSRGGGAGAGAAGGSSGGGHPSGVSLMNSAFGSNIMSSGAEHSIVSFGLNLNFNFDNTSSPSNSDSGEGGAPNDGKEGGGSSEEDVNVANNHDRGSADGAGNGSGKLRAPPVLKNGGGGGVKALADNKKKGGSHHHKHKDKKPDLPNSRGKEGSGKGSDKGGSVDDKSNGKGSGGGKAKKQASVKFRPGPNGATAAAAGEEGSGSSTSSGSDSSMANENDSGDSRAWGGSNSGNDGSSGGKSTVSSLTTSSNQEWMSTNESAEAAAAAAAAAANGTGVEAKAPGPNPVARAEEKKDAVSGKKRKKVTITAAPTGVYWDVKKVSAAPDRAGGTGGGGNEDDDGYKTDEEQWGGGKSGQPSGGPAVVATHKASSLKPAGGVGAAGPVVGAGGAATPLVPGVGGGGGGSSSLSKNSSGDASGSGSAPPSKQARFSLHHRHSQGHPRAVQSADASAQPLSSLSGSDSAGVPAVTTSSGGAGGRVPGLSGSSATAAPTSLNPSSSSRPPKSESGGPAVRFQSVQGGTGGAVTTNPEKRKERNAREKERSCRIARQIDDLQSLLGRGGVIVSKGTKSSVLAEAANYINLLQQQQIQWEMDRQALMQQMQQVGVGAQAPLHSQMAGGVTQAQQLQQIGALQQQGAAVPGQSGLPTNPLTGQPQQQPLGQQPTPNSVCPDDYKFIFDNSSVGMAIASLGGAFIDCNSIFCQLSEYTREEVCSLTIFNMTSRQDLQQAFDLISQMITPTLDGNGASAASPDKLESSIVLRGAMKKHNDLGLSVSLIKGDQGIAKCFCVTLVRILSMEATRPDTVSIEMELPQVWSTKQQKNVGFGASPAYTSG